MNPRILITKFNYNLRHMEFRQLLETVAPDFAKVPGCRWKIWLIDESKNEGGAIYLFDDDIALDMFTKSELVQSVMSHPALSDFVFRITDTVDKPGVLTHAPMERMTAAALSR